MRCFARVAVLALALVTVPLVLAPRSVSEPVTPGTWGPQAVPYLAGRVCDTPVGSAALVAWSNLTSARPAYALDPVVGPPAEESAAAPYARPAIEAQMSQLSAGVGGLSQQQVAALSYLLATHGAARSDDAVAEVAAVVASIRADSAVVDSCLTNGAVSAASVDALWQQALRRAGPYSVQVSSAAAKLTLGQPDAVTATVTTASGQPVPGVTVSIAVAGADLERTEVVTGADGQASTALTVPTGSTARAVRVRATAAVPGGVSFAAAPGAATLVSADPATAIAAATTVPIDTTADPVVATTLTQSVALEGTLISTRLVITGLRGHSGTGAVTMRGPLPLRGTQGCAGYGSANWAKAPGGPTATSVPGVGVADDGSYPTGAVTPTQAGCYQLAGQIVTTNAIPKVTRASPAVVLAVVPMQIGLASANGGITLPGGQLSADVAVQGTVPGQLSDFSGRLLGPLPSDDGSCTHANWDATAASIPVTATATAHGATLTSAPVHTLGCYAFRASSTLQVPGAGSLPLTVGDDTHATGLVLDPTVSVIALSKSSAPTGGQLDASVTVSGSFTQAGTLHLQLVHLPYDWRGCFARDWSHATVVATLEAPAVATAGDGTYTVPSPKVPTDGCWTVLPELELNANPGVHVATTTVTDPMLAFTGVDMSVDAAPRDVSDLIGGNGDTQVILSALLVFALLVAAAAATIAIAVRTIDD